MKKDHPNPRPSPPGREAIAERAYQLFLQRGGVHGYSVEDWLQAERELNPPVSTPPLVPSNGLPLGLRLLE